MAIAGSCPHGGVVCRTRGTSPVFANGSFTETQRRECRTIEHSMMRQSLPGLGTAGRVRGRRRACRGHDRLG